MNDGAIGKTYWRLLRIMTLTTYVTVKVVGVPDVNNYRNIISQTFF